MKTEILKMNLLQFEKHIITKQPKKFLVTSSNNESETPCTLYYSFAFEKMNINVGRNRISFENSTGEYSQQLKIDGIKAIHLLINSNSSMYSTIDIKSCIGNETFTLRVIIDY